MNTPETPLGQPALVAAKHPSAHTLALPVVGAAAALSVSIPHALGVGLVAFGPLSTFVPASALALWSAAVPGALLTLLARSPGVVYAPSTAVALLFGGMLALVVQAGTPLGMNAGQALAITGVFVALGFWLQWVMGRLGLLRLARFIPLSVTQGFAAGVGLSLVLAQLTGIWDVSGARWGPLLGWHVGIALAVAGLSQGLQSRWPRFPALLAAVAVVTFGCWLLLPSVPMKMVPAPQGFMLPVFPDWWNAPWSLVLEAHGFQLASLALLMAVVNALEVSVFHQQMEVEYGVRRSLEQVMGREAGLAAVCALLGMIPASSSTSRSRTALSYTRRATLRPAQWHAMGLLLVALTGHLWLGWVPTAVLIGALCVAGLRMVPIPMWPLTGCGQQRTTRLQSWGVALVFVASSGAMALLAGLAVAMVDLLRASGAHAIRRIHLQGKLRSRHVRRAEVEQWLASRMNTVAVFELQGIVSFGVAAMVVDQVRLHTAGHRCVIIDAARVPLWDETACQRIRALATELGDRGISCALSGLRGWVAQAMHGVQIHADLDRALEWAEEQLLLSKDAPQAISVASNMQAPHVLGELGASLTPLGREALIQRMVQQTYGPRETIIRQGDNDRSLLLVPQGSVTLSTQANPNMGMRLSVIGAGAMFGEMAFFNGMPRTAYAHAGENGAEIGRLNWEDFQAWSKIYPQDALELVTAMTRVEVRRLADTSQELRAAMA